MTAIMANAVVFGEPIRRAKGRFINTRYMLCVAVLTQKSMVGACPVMMPHIICNMHTSLNLQLSIGFAVGQDTN